MLDKITHNCIGTCLPEQNNDIFPIKLIIDKEEVISSSFLDYNIVK